MDQFESGAVRIVRVWRVNRTFHDGNSMKLNDILLVIFLLCLPFAWGFTLYIMCKEIDDL